MAICLGCGENYEKPKKSRASYCKKCSDFLKKPSRLNLPPLQIRTCYDMRPTRKG